MSRPKISVLIATYNQLYDYLREAINSVAIAFPSLATEIIVCDDGSDREALSAAKEICEISNVRFLSLARNCGMNVARNMCAFVATGEYLLILDSDDALAPNIEGAVVQALKERPAFMFADHSLVDITLSYPIQRRIKERYFSILKEYRYTSFNPFFFSTFCFHPQIYRRDIFSRLGGFDCSYSSGDEIDLQIRISLLRCETISYVPVDAYSYRKNPNSVVHDPILYSQLVDNIQSIICKHYWNTFGQQIRAERIGREALLHAAHYRLYEDFTGIPLDPPWFDIDDMRIIK